MPRNVVKALSVGLSQTLIFIVVEVWRYKSGSSQTIYIAPDILLAQGPGLVDELSCTYAAIERSAPRKPERCSCLPERHGEVSPDD